MRRQLKLRKYEPLEKDIQNAILEYLRAKRVFCWKEHSSGIYKQDGTGYIPLGLKGKADILGCHNGKFLAIEVKRPSGKLSVEQYEFLTNIRNAGGIAFVATSIDDVILNGI